MSVLYIIDGFILWAGRKAPVSEWDFATTFPRLRRYLAVLMETLRLYPPVGSPKWTDEHTKTLTLHGGGKDIVLPPDTIVVSNFGDLHVNSKYYGPNPLMWRPDRWIKAGGVAGDKESLPLRRGSSLHGLKVNETAQPGSFRRFRSWLRWPYYLVNASVDPTKEEERRLNKRGRE